jgi:uncharacterized protein (TIGR03086 family)
MSEPIRERPTGMDEIGERYRRRADRFEQLLAAVQPDQWDDPTPCAAWDVRALVGHVVDMHRVVLRSTSLGFEPLDDPVGAFRQGRAAVEAVLADGELRRSSVATPVGPMPLERHVDEVPSDDLPLHGWDLAAATGQDRRIDPEDVDRLWAQVSAIPPDLLAKYRTPGAFGPGIEVYGPEVVVPVDAPQQDRLLGFIGRSPRWPA